MPHRRHFILALVAMATFADMLVYGIIIPFLPLHAESLGVSKSLTGLLFGTYALAAIVASWGLEWTARHVTAQGVLVAGMVTLCLANAIFAISAEFPIGLFLGRGMQGVAAAAAWVAGPSLVARHYSADSRGQAMGALLTASSSGLLLGPPLGGALYTWGGFGLPFLVIGLLAALLAGLAAVLLRRGEDTSPRRASDESPPMSLRQLLSVPGIRRGGTVVFFGSYGIALLEPIIPLHLTHAFSTSVLENGLYFGLMVLCYGAMAPVVGRLSDRLGREPIILGGLFSLGIVFPLFCLLPDLGWAVVALCLVGIAFSVAITPSMAAMADGVDGVRGGGAHKHRASDYMTTFAIYNLIYNFGLLLGPTMGGVTVELFGLPEAVISTGVAAAVAAIILVVIRR